MFTLTRIDFHYIVIQITVYSYTILQFNFEAINFFNVLFYETAIIWGLLK